MSSEWLRMDRIAAEIAALGAGGHRRDAEPALPVVREREQRAAEDDLPARHHRLARDRLGGEGHRQDLPDRGHAEQDQQRDAVAAQPAHGATRSAGAGGRRGAGLETEVGQQHVLVAHHLSLEQAVGGARPRCLDRKVVDQPAAVHHQDAVGEDQRLVDVVGHEHDGAPRAGIGLRPERQQDRRAAAAW